MAGLGSLRGAKLAVTSLVATMLATGLIACGSDDPEPASTSASNSAATTGSEGGEGSGAEQGGGKQKGNSEGKGSSGVSGESQQPKEDLAAEYHGPSASSFVPKQHDDSATGSEQFASDEEDRNSLTHFGSEASGSEFNEAAAAFHNFMDSRAAGNWAAMCEYFSKDFLQALEAQIRADQMGPRDCAGLIESQGAYTTMSFFKQEATRADVESVRVDGDRAFAIYWGAEGNVYAYPMDREADGWKVTMLAPMPVCVDLLPGSSCADH